MELFYDILKQLIRVPSVVGAEHPKNKNKEKQHRE